MKRLLFVLLICTPLCSTLFAQETVRNKNGSYYRKCTHFEISRPVSELAREFPASKKPGKEQDAKDAARRNGWKTPSNVPFSADPIAQRQQGSQAPAATIANFNGATSSQGYTPFDPSGMVGPNHFVQVVNSDYQIFNKTGTALTAAISLSTLFPGSTDDGDPIVMYDKFADRWIITEFQASATGNPNGNENELLFAVSQTGNPLGSYYLYTFLPDAADFADYPKFSIWSDGYYETCNCDLQKVTVYERTKMLAGDPTAGFIVIPSLSAPNPAQGFFCPQTLFADGALPPYGSPQYLFYFTDDNWGAGYTDMIHIYQITADWTTKTGTIANYDSLVPQPFNSYFTGGTMKDLSQPGTTTKLDALDGFFAYRIPYLRWGTYNAAVMAQAVNVGSGTTRTSGIRWYELRQDTTTAKWSIFQQGTYAPADGVSRWNPGIGMDINGGIGLAYSVVAPTSVYPGIRYTGRAQCDSSGMMTMAEGVAIAGTGASGGYRWGDYSHTSLDPTDGITFWHTNQYRGSSLKTRIFSWQVNMCSTTGMGTVKNNAAINLSAFQAGTQLTIKATNLNTENIIDIGLYDAEGRLVKSKTVAPVLGGIETEINVFGLSNGMYYLRLGNSSFQRVIKVNVLQ
jgi:hypothetical protein